MLHTPSIWPTPAEARGKAKPTSLTTLEIDLSSQQTSGSGEVATTAQIRDEIVPNQTRGHQTEVPQQTTMVYDEWLLKGKMLELNFFPAAFQEGRERSSKWSIQGQSF